MTTCDIRRISIPAPNIPWAEGASPVHMAEAAAPASPNRISVIRAREISISRTPTISPKTASALSPWVTRAVQFMCDRPLIRSPLDVGT